MKNLPEQLKEVPSKIEDDEDLESMSIYTLEKELSDFVNEEPSASSRPSYETYPGAETFDYDFTAERKYPYSTNFLESTAHLIKACLGAGMLGIHEAFMHGGLWTSLVATVIVGVIVPYTMLMLVRSAHKMYHRIRIPRLSYPDLIEAAVATGPLKKFRKYSKICRYILDVMLFVEMCGSCCLFEIMIAITFKQLLEGISSEIKALDMSLRMYIIFITLPLLAICMIRSLKYLAPLSVAANVFVTVCVLATMYYSISLNASLSDRPAWKSVQGLFRFLGVCIYAVEGISVTLPIENHMKYPEDFSAVLLWGMSVVTIFTTAVGFFGYWGLGEHCKSPITMHIPFSNATIAIQLLIMCMMGITFAIHFWVPFKVIWHYLGKRHRRKRGIWERLYKGCHVLLISCVALALPELNVLMSCVGAFCLTITGFIIPAFIEISVTWKEHKKGHIRWRLIKNLLIMIFGIVVCCGAVYSFI